MRRLALAVVLARAAVAHAQSVACEPCARGAEILGALGAHGEVLRSTAPELVRLWVPLGITIAGEAEPEEGRVILFTLRDTPGLFDAVRALRGWSDAELLAIAAALCEAPDVSCTEPLAGALRVASQADAQDLAAMNALIVPERRRQGCDPTAARTSSPRTGLDLEYAAGWQGSARPVDGTAWSLGLALRRRVSASWNLVARFDRSSGRDAADDADGDGRDDAGTGTVTRWTALAGPSLRLVTHRAANEPRAVELDVLGGWSRSGDRSGPVAAIDLAYRFLAFRLGARVLQGFADARDDRALLVHAGLGFGAGPEYWTGGGCDFIRHPRGSAWALGIDVPAGGWLQHVGGIAPGFGIEAARHGRHGIDLVLGADLLDLPNGGRDRILIQSALAGMRLDFSRARRTSGTRTGWLATASAGYARVAAPSSSPVDSGPIVDVAVGWGAQGSDGAANVRLHARFGLAPDDAVLPALFLSAGIELRLDRSRWADRE